MQINKLKNSGRVVADITYGKHCALGRSYGRYDIGEIVAGTPREVELPWKLQLDPVPPTQSAISENAGEMPNMILNDGHAPYTYYFLMTDMDDGLVVDLSGITEYLVKEGRYTAVIDLHFKATNPTINAYVGVANGENNFQYLFFAHDYLRIRCYMAKREWLNAPDGIPILLPVYMRPVT